MMLQALTMTLAFSFISLFLWASHPNPPTKAEPEYFKASPNDSVTIMGMIQHGRELYHKQKYHLTLELCDELEQRLDTLNFLRGAAEVYFLKGRTFNQLGLPQEALYNYKRSSNLFVELNTISRLASVYNNLTIILKDQGDFNQALKYGNEALLLSDDLNLPSLLASIHNNLGSTYLKLAKYQQATNHYYKALEVIKDLPEKNIKRVAFEVSVYMNLAIIYFDQRLYPKSLELYNQALEISIDNNLNKNLADINYNIGSVLIELNAYKSSLEYLSKALYLSSQNKDKLGITLSMFKFGEIHFYQDRTRQGLAEMTHAIETIKKMNTNAYLPSMYFSVGNCYMKLNQWKKAERIFLKALDIALLSEAKVSQLNLYKSLVNVYRNTNNLSNALRYYDLYTLLSQQLNDQQIGRIISKKESEILLNQRDAQLALLNKEADVLRFEMDKRNALLLISALIIGLLILLFYVIYTQYKIKSESVHTKLEHKLLLSQLDPHFIFNSLAAIQDFIYQRNSMEAGRYLAKFAALMRKILYSSRNDKIKLCEELEYIAHYLELQAIRFQNRLTYSIEVDNNVDTANITVPTMLLQPVVENAVEHGIKSSDQAGNVKIKVWQYGENLCLEVTDNGIGIEKAEMKVKDPSSTKGLGNKIIRERLQRLNFRKKKKIGFFLNSLNPEDFATGTRARFEIPL